MVIFQSDALEIIDTYVLKLKSSVIYFGFFLIIKIMGEILM